MPSEKTVEAASTKSVFRFSLTTAASFVSRKKNFSKLPFLEVANKFLFYMFRELHDPFFPRLSFSPPSPQSLSQNIQTSDGIHSQHKQMNILQTITSNGGALQVIQAQSVQKSSSRRAITSTSYSSQFSSNFTNGVGHGSYSSGHPMTSDLLVRLIKFAS